MELNEVALALASIDGKHWHAASTKSSIVLFVAVETIGNAGAQGMLVPLGRRLIAERTGLEERWAHRVIGELVDERVLTIESESAGSRGRAYAIQPELRVWRAPWRVPIALVEYHAAIVSGRLARHNPRIAARYSAPQTAIAARYSAPQNGPSGALWRATNGGPAARYSAPQTRANGASHPLPDLSLSTTGAQPVDQEQEQKASTIVRAISRRTRGVLFGGLPDRVKVAVDGLDDDQLTKLAKSIETYPNDGHGPPLLVAFAEQQADALRHGEWANVRPASTVELEEKARADLADRERWAQEARPMPEALRNRLGGAETDLPA